MTQPNCFPICIGNARLDTVPMWLQNVIIQSFKRRHKFRVDPDWTVSDGIWYFCVFMGFAVEIGHLLIMGAHWSIDNYRPLNYLSGFAENWLKGVCMCQDETCEIISQPDHSFNSYDQKSKCSIYVYHWISICMKILVASDTESGYRIRCTWVLSLHLYRWEQCMYNRSPERDQYIENLKT